jgi:hypothetical protein
MKWLYIALGNLAILSAVANFFVVYNTSDGRKPKVLFSLIALLFSTILFSVASFVATDLDNKQKDRIEELGEITKKLGCQNKSLSDQIYKLTQVNNKLDSNTNKIVIKIDSVTVTANNLITEVKKLSLKSNTVIHGLDVKTDEEFNVSGVFSFPIDSTLSNGTIINSLVGDGMGPMFNLIEV